MLATGVSYRQLVAAGVDELVGRGVYYGSASTQATACAGDHVIIVGGANSAGQAAVFFSRHAAQVTLAVRGDSLERSMSSYLIEQIAAIDTIDVRLNTRSKCNGADHLECVTLVDARRRPAGRRRGDLFVFIGAAPLTDWLPAELITRRARVRGTGPDLVVDGQRPPAGTSTATRTCWSRASRACSSPATYGRSR